MTKEMEWYVWTCWSGTWWKMAVTWPWCPKNHKMLMIQIKYMVGIVFSIMPTYLIDCSIDSVKCKAIRCAWCINKSLIWLLVIVKSHSELIVFSLCPHNCNTMVCFSFPLQYLGIYYLLKYLDKLVLKLKVTITMAIFTSGLTCIVMWNGHIYIVRIKIIKLCFHLLFNRGRRGRYRMLVGFTTTYAISA